MAHAAVFFPLLLGLDNRVNSLLSKRGGNFLGSKVLFVLTHAGLCELFAVFSFMCCWSENPHMLVCDLQEWRGFNLFFILRNFLKSATLRRCRRRIVLRIKRLLYQSSNILCLSVHYRRCRTVTGLLSRMLQHCWKMKLKPPQIVLPSFCLKCCTQCFCFQLQIEFFKGGSET